MDFTPRASECIKVAAEWAENLGHSAVGNRHLLMGLLAIGAGVQFDALTQAGLTLQRVRKIQEQIPVQPESSISFLERCLAVSAQATVNRASTLARDQGMSYVGTQHILLALLSKPDEVVTGIFRAAGADPAVMRFSLIESGKNWAVD